MLEKYGFNKKNTRRIRCLWNLFIIQQLFVFSWSLLSNVVLLFKTSFVKNFIDPMTELGNIHIGTGNTIIETANTRIEITKVVFFYHCCAIDLIETYPKQLLQPNSIGRVCFVESHSWAEIHRHLDRCLFQFHYLFIKAIRLKMQVNGKWKKNYPISSIANHNRRLTTTIT